MKLTDLLLNRFLYKDNLQNLETKDSSYNAGNVIEAEVPAIASGGAAQDINTSNVFIDGNQIEPGTIPQTVLDVSNWGWGQTCAFTSTDLNTVSWGVGTFKSADGTSYSITAGNTGNMAGKTYIYLDLNVSDTAYQITTTAATSVGIGKVLIAVANPDTASATFNLSEAQQLIGDNILANSINASKIVAGSITATQISGTYVYAGTLVASQITSGTIDASIITVSNLNASNIITGSLSGINLSIGSGNDIFKATASGIQLGHATFASAPFSVNMLGEVIAKKITVTTTDSVWQGTPIADAYVGNLTAAKITSGTISVGATNQPGLLTIIQSTAGGGGTTTAKLNWESTGGTSRGKIWADSSGYMGYNAIGGKQYFYCADEQVMVLQSGGNRAIFYKDVGLDGNYIYGNSGSTESLYGGNSGRYEYNASTYHYLNIGGNLRLRLSDSGLTQYSTSGSPEFFTNWIRQTGSAAQIGESSGRFYLYGSTVRYTTLTNDSDRKLKKNISSFRYGLDDINKLIPIKFEYDGIENESGTHLGFIAQEVEEVIPELVSEDEGTKCLSTIELIPVLVKSIQELNQKIKRLESKLPK